VVLADDVLSPFIKGARAEQVAYLQDDRRGFASVAVPLRVRFGYSVGA
jgi:hypothetical protein